MAVKICTTGGKCITCNATVAGVMTAIKKAGREGFVCCNSDSKCVAVAHITTVETVARGEEGEEEEKRGRRSEEETEEITTFP